MWRLRHCVSSAVLLAMTIHVPQTGAGPANVPSEPRISPHFHDGPRHIPPDEWVEIAPPARAEHVTVFDPKRRDLIVFGGQVDHAARSDVWVLSLSGHRTWRRLATEGVGPSPRFGAAGVFDPAEDRVLIFGGRDDPTTYHNDLWELSLRGRPRWTRLFPRGDLPSPRYHHTLTLDPENRQLVLIGGSNGYNSHLAETWRIPLSGYAWERMRPNGLWDLARSSHSAVFCPDLHGVLVFGGEITSDFGPVVTGELWLLTTRGDAHWRNLTSPAPGVPCGLEGQSAIYDPSGHRMIVVGGGAFLGPCDGIGNSFWTLSLPDLRWQKLSFSGDVPHARVYAGVAVDSEENRMLLYGGEGSLNGGACDADTWELSIGPELSWARVTPGGSIPDFRVNHSAIYDPINDRIVLYDGSNAWTRSLRDDAGWSPLDVAGEKPPSRSSQIGVYDSKRSRLIILGGSVVESGYRRPMTDAWALSLGQLPAWSQISIDGPAPSAVNASAIYDPIRDQIATLASRDDGFSYDSVWALPLRSSPTSWRLLAPGPGPLPRHETTMVYDPSRDRMVVFGGGYSWSDGWSEYNDSWALSLDHPDSWIEIASTPRPTRRRFHSAIYDSWGDRMIVVGGLTGGYPSGNVGDDSWEFSFSDDRWMPLTDRGGPVPSWVGATIVYDSRRDRTIVIQGDLTWTIGPGRPGDNAEKHEDLVAGASEDDVQGTVRARDRTAILGVRPNPSRTDFLIEYVLDDATRATLELLDISGRRLWSRPADALGPGPHTMSVAPSRPLRPGVYMIRLTCRTASCLRKVVRLE